MAYKISFAFKKGTWDGVPEASNFTQSETTYNDTAEFALDYSNADITAIINEYVGANQITNRQSIIVVPDGKVRINTTEFIDEATRLTYSADSRWAAEEAVTKGYAVELAPTPEDVNTFDEDLEVYYHTSEHLF